MLAIAMMLVVSAPDAGAPLVLRLEGRTPSSITLSELAALGPVTVEWSDKQGPHQVTGIRLDTLLPRLGYEEGPTGPQREPRQKHRGLRAALVATAADGYEAVFSVGEVQEGLGATTALVVWQMDGKPLASTMGPLRLVVVSDRRGTRSLHQLVSLRLVDLAAR